MFQPNEFHHPRHREIPNILEKICWNLSKAFLEKDACSFELCLPSFTMQPLNHDQRRSRADNGGCPVLSGAITSSCGFRKNEPSCATTSKGDFRQRAVLHALQSTVAHRQQDKQLAARRADEPVLKIECEQR
jgi:hypothetical protein